ncbi:sugar-binding domain-containing protein [Limibacter armeniacum]|uniref:glycoside hydrolase family 2 protein n=1 Tax=Limibacter armeniacum TaxID=466084 RepID=UPI002FE551A7
MKKLLKIGFGTILIFLLSGSMLYGQGYDVVTHLTKQTWHLWLDETAEWENDSLYLPNTFQLEDLPVNAPTCGWDELAKGKGKSITLPATVEEHYWGWNGSRFGVTGDYVGVSWFVTRFKVPETQKGKRLVLDFESVRMRAEVYVNGKLTGYNLINNTPFEADITEAVHFEKENILAVRVTDPNGNFAWRDWDKYQWGNFETPPSHGFGGITSHVKLRVTDQTFIEDVFIKNHPDPKQVTAEINLQNLSSTATGGTLSLEIREWKTGQLLTSRKLKVDNLKDEKRVSEKFKVSQAKLWSPDTPHLYTMQVKWEGNDGTKHQFDRRFGFRWFDVVEKNGDKQFELNGKRIVLRTAISWGFWPVNGMYPTPELARKQVETAKQLGLNMLSFHRCIGQTPVFDMADELGLLYYEEPGGYKAAGNPFVEQWNTEKMLRMVKRDRSRPSLVMYNMINEVYRDPLPVNVEDIQKAHKLDETRLITFSSNLFTRKFYEPLPLDSIPPKLHMTPYSHKVQYFGMLDKHNAGGPGVYADNFYNGPDQMRRGELNNHPQEIIYWGEDGAIGTPHRLELIKKELEKGGQLGWDGDAYIRQYEAFDNFLKQNGFDKAFPTVDSLTKALGAVAHYYQGRMIENIRIGNVSDGYVVNGWEGEKIENHSGIVDIYRNPKADPSILAYYNQPLYVAVKLRDKVGEVGDTLTADFHIINEQHLKGSFDLLVQATDEKGTVLEKTFKVKVTGGDRYGELLLSGINIPLRQEGYATLTAKLIRNGKTFATGKEKLLGVALPAISQLKVAVKDTAGTVQQMLQTAGIAFNDTYSEKKSLPEETVLFVGKDMQPGFFNTNFRMNDPYLDWVSQGNTLIISGGTENWGSYLMLKEAADFRGSRKMWRDWFGGNYIVKEHPLFEGLPVNTVFNWEYQTLALYQRDRTVMRMHSGECVVGAYADNKAEFYSALSVIPFGKGQIIVSSLDLEGALKEGGKAAVVAKRILLNMARTGTATKQDI